jgi:uncharacterized protein GlcG (DUF336 family)
MRRTSLIAALLSAAATLTHAQSAAVFTTQSLVPEIALQAAKAALDDCRARGYQVGVAVVDRSGNLQAFVRDRFAGAHTIEAATRKAWSAASLRLSSASLANETQAGKPMSGLRGLDKFLAAAGALPIEAGGSALGAIGVSGAPGGEADEACAQQGIKAISDAINF